MKKVILINNIISPVCIHICKNINIYLKQRKIDFKVIFLSISDKNRNWKKEKNIPFKYDILNNFAIRFYGKDLNTFFINTSVTEKLNKEDPDQIICFGWDHLASYVANRWARKNKKEFILWSGSTKYEKSWRRNLFAPLVKHLIKKTDSFITYGTRAKEYLISLGAKAEKIKILYHTIDIDYFQKKSEDFSEEQKKALKERLGIKTSKIILFSGQLIERKGIFELLEGFRKYQNIDKDISLLIIGNGKEKNKIQKIIKNKEIKNIIFTDFIQYPELYKYYSISDLLILPSREEVWGLVINEAMACGLPVITTAVTGASIDLVEEGKNGYVINSKSPQEITNAIKKVFKNKLHINNNSWKIIQKTNISKQIKTTFL